MSDPIETGARRHLQRIARPRTQSLGRREKTGLPADKVDLDPFIDLATVEIGPEERKALETSFDDDVKPGLFTNEELDKSERKETAKAHSPEQDEVELGRFAEKKADSAKSKKPTSSHSTEQDEVELGRFAGKKRNNAKRKKTATSHSFEEDEVELGRFTGEIFDDIDLETTSVPCSPNKSEVVGPMRQKVVSDDAKAARRRAGTELEIATTRDTSEDSEPSRPRAKRRSRPNTKPAMGRFGLSTLVLFGVLLVAATALTFILLPRYQIVGEPLLTQGSLDGGLENWKQAGHVTKTDDDTVGIKLKSINPEERTYLVREVELPPGDSLLVLRARVQGQAVQPGPEYWDQARIYLAQIGQDGEVLWKEDHNLFLLNGTTEPRNYSRAYRIPEEVEIARLGIELKNATGALTVNDLELEVAERPLAFLVIAGVLILGWIVLVPYSAIQLVRGIQSVQIQIWLIVVLSLSIAGLFLPASLYQDQLREIAYRFGIEDIDAIGHGIIFALLAFLVRQGRPFDPIWLHAGLWLLIGVASEVLQLFTVDREPSLIDLTLDGVGIVIGLALAEIMQPMRRSRMA